MSVRRKREMGVDEVRKQGREGVLDGKVEEAVIDAWRCRWSGLGEGAVVFELERQMGEVWRMRTRVQSVLLKEGAVLRLMTGRGAAGNVSVEAWLHVLEVWTNRRQQLEAPLEGARERKTRGRMDGESWAGSLFGRTNAERSPAGTAVLEEGAQGWPGVVRPCFALERQAEAS
jgi:hypothetical protein